LAKRLSENCLGDVTAGMAEQKASSPQPSPPEEEREKTEAECDPQSFKTRMMVECPAIGAGCLYRLEPVRSAVNTVEFSL
jgi:hypothetical protein